MYCFLELINFFIALVLNWLLCVSKLLHIILSSCHFIVSIWRDMETTILDSQDPSKQKWTPAEDIKLVEALLKYHHEKEGNPENKFKPRYLKILEGKISTKLPNAGLRAKLHIESRLRTLKREFQVIHEMLTGPNTSGFGWDIMRKCVTVENDEWDAYVQVKFTIL